MSTSHDGIRDFFARHHAVPASDSGPDFPSAADDALLGWLNGECDLLRRGTGDPRRVILKAVLAEAWARVGRLTKECAAHGTDWPGRNIFRGNKPGDVYGDYVFGRMMKLDLRWDAAGVEFTDGPPRPDYQGWCARYPTTEALVRAAIESLAAAK